MNHQANSSSDQNKQIKTIVSTSQGHKIQQDPTRGAIKIKLQQEDPEWEHVA
ncbi:uncharacterized protein G2W53_017529 [Senna tora]|uniref:Uncharacterized protein n=1 Tax=Senna tora TaxID=362788 RepID=A0A834TQJ4_9FABA|nr:uncharacterized protein G2W53_017529 [Senna tora]